MEERRGGTIVPLAGAWYFDTSNCATAKEMWANLQVIHQSCDDKDGMLCMLYIYLCKSLRER